MSATIAIDEVPAVQVEARDLTRRQVQEWFNWMDRILDIHRSNFVYRQPTPEELAQHQKALRIAFYWGHAIKAVFAAFPDSSTKDLVAGLQIRIRQLEDAYDTFHNETLSDAQAETILQKVFPE